MAKKITIEQLAEMVKRGFDATATKEDIKELHEEMNGLHEEMVDLHEEMDGLHEEMNGLRGEMNTHFDHLDARVGRIEADIHELRDEVVYRHEFEDALGRIKYLEKKLGIESGV